MGWLINLLMTGKGPPLNGAESFTALSCSATPGRLQTFNAKTAAGSTRTILYFLKFLAEVG